MTVLVDRLVVFSRALRAAGVGVTPPQLEGFVRALAHVGVASPVTVRNAARTTLATSRHETALLDAVFDRVWLGRSAEAPVPLAPPAVTAAIALGGAARDEAEPTEEAGDRTGTWSAREQLRRKHFDRLTAAEAEQVRRLLAAAAWQGPERRTRRFRRATSGAVPDWRRTVRDALRFEGELLVRRFRRRTAKPRPLVVLADVSGSMERFARPSLTFVHAVAQRARRAGRRGAVEVFVFGTRLTRVTRAFMARGTDRALDEAASRAPDWAGGTRIGEALHRFNRVWGRRILHRGPIVVVVSDGWDQGEPRQIAREMARLRRTCHRLIWLHPLAGTAGFAPETRGLLAALPSVDALLPAGSVAELERAFARFDSPAAATQRGDGSMPATAPEASGRSRAAPRQVRQPLSGRSR